TTPLDRFHRDGRYILDQANFLLQEWLAVCDSCERAVEARHGFDAGTDFGASGKDIFAGFLVTELRLVGHERLEARFELIGDIYDKGRADIVIQGRVDNFEGAMRSETNILLLVSDHARHS